MKKLQKIQRLHRLLTATISLTLFVLLIAVASNEKETEAAVRTDGTSYNTAVVQVSNMSLISTQEKTTETSGEKQSDEADKLLFSDENREMLLKIAMTEAEGESTEGKALVICVVLNRVKDEAFPNSIHEVIFQTNQFTPVSNGQYDKCEPDADCYKALELITNGWDESGGALYFENCANADNWHKRNLDFLYRYGNHNFYK